MNSPLQTPLLRIAMLRIAMLRTGTVLLTAGALLMVFSVGLISCKSDEAALAPAAPALPAAWTVKADKTYEHDDGEFLEIEGRLKGTLKALRVTTYEVHGHLVQLNTLVPASREDGDKVFRILANKKKPSSYLRKGEVLYEFVGPNEAEKDIAEAYEVLSR